MSWKAVLRPKHKWHMQNFDKAVSVCVANQLLFSCPCYCRRTVFLAAPGDQKRLVEVFVPIGADDGDKIVVDGEGAPSEFQGNYHTPSAYHFTPITLQLSHLPADWAHSNLVS